MYRIGLLLMLGLITRTSLAQDNPFEIGVFGGFTAAQVQGDGLGGFNKPGITGGLSLKRKVKQNWSVGFNISYVQKGSRRVQDLANNDYRYYRMSLHYVEVPVLAYYQLKKISVYLGPSIAKLLKATEESDNGFFPVVNPFKELEFGLVGGVNYRFKPRWTVGMGFQESISSIRNTPVYSRGAFGRFQGQYNTVLNLTIQVKL